MAKFKFYHDAGHGWLAVPKTTLALSGITPTQYSYQKGQTVYLEEDCDAPKFIEAIKNFFLTVDIIEVSHGNRSPIRSYERFQQ